MPDVTIDQLTPKTSPVDGDQFELDDGAGGSFKTTKAQLLAEIQAEVDLNTVKQTNATHTGEVTGSGALTITNDAVTNAKLGNMTANTLKGRTGSTGNPQDLTKAQAQTLLNVEDGATGDQTKEEIKTLYEDNANTNAFTDAEKAAVADNSLKVSADGSIGTHSDVDVTTAAPQDDDVLTFKTGEWVPSAATGGGAGTFNEAEKDSVSQSVGRAKLDFRDSGEATVTVTDDPENDRTIVEINASAGAGGGGTQAGTPFVVGDLLQVESTAGDGTIQSAGVALSALVQKADSIDALSDVDTTTAAPTTNQVLAWNNTNWVPADAAGGLAPGTTDGAVLRWEATGGVWQEVTTVLINDAGDLLSAKPDAAANTFSAGLGAGETLQDVGAVAIGANAGNANQGRYSIAYGYTAAQTNQGDYGTALGYEAGQTGQGTRSVAIGMRAGQTNQGDNGVIISSSGVILDDTTVGHIHLASTLAELAFVTNAWTFTGGTVVNAPAFAGDGSAVTNVDAVTLNNKAATDFLEVGDGLNDLSDVTISNSADKQGLVYSGSTIVNGFPYEVGAAVPGSTAGYPEGFLFLATG